MLIFISQICCEEDKASKPLYDSATKDRNFTSFSNDTWTSKILRRNELEQEGCLLAKQGQYEEAIVKFRLAVDPSLIVQAHEKAVPIGSIVDAYQREGKFEEAVKEHEWFITGHNPPAELAIEKRAELNALIKARDIKNNKPIHDFIDYLKTKHAKNLPPNGYVTGESLSLITHLIHLYDYLHDYDSGITLMNEAIKYLNQGQLKSVYKTHVREYTRVKQAWELDKKTGQHGHLQEVIRTSDVISW